MFQTASKIKQNLVIAALSLALIGGTMLPMTAETVCAAPLQPAIQATAANPEIPITGASFPKSVSLKPGESKTLTINVTPSNTTYLTNIEWGYQTNNCIKVKTNGCGSYWGKPASETITAEKAGTGYLNNTVKVYDSTGKYLTKYEFSTTVTVSGSADTQPAATQPTQQQTTNANAITAEVPIKNVSFPGSVSLKKGESKTLSVSTTPSNTTYLTNIEWGYQPNGCFKVKTNGYGSYYGKPASETITAEKAGTGYLNTTVKIYDSTGKYITKYQFSTTVTVTDPSASQATTTKPAQQPTQQTTQPTQQQPTQQTQPTTAKATEKYWNVSEAYTLLNKFRTTKSNQWYWKSNNKTKQKVSGLKNLKRDAQLEKIAKLRAKEQWIMAYERGKYTHTRPNGKSWSTAYPKSLTFKAENLGWGYYSCKAAVTDPDGWAETYEKYEKQGHRRSMLSKKATKVGIACYEKDGETCWAMCLGN